MKFNLQVLSDFKVIDHRRIFLYQNTCAIIGYIFEFKLIQRHTR